MGWDEGGEEKGRLLDAVGPQPHARGGGIRSGKKMAPLPAYIYLEEEMGWGGDPPSFLCFFLLRGGRKPEKRGKKTAQVFYDPPPPPSLSSTARGCWTERH